MAMTVPEDLATMALVALNTQAPVEAHMLALEGLDTPVLVATHTMVLVAAHTMVREGLDTPVLVAARTMVREDLATMAPVAGLILVLEGQDIQGLAAAGESLQTVVDLNNLCV